MISLDQLVTDISPKLKKLGYKKNRFTWHKPLGEITVVFSIQRSMYTPDVWWYIFGVCLNEIAEYRTQTISACQITYRTDSVVNSQMISPDDLVQLIQRWEERYGDIRSLKICAVKGRLPGQYTMKAMRYLTSGDVSLL